MKEIDRHLVNKFIVWLVIKALGPEFTKSMYNSLLESYSGFKPEGMVLNRQFSLLMEYFYSHLDAFTDAVGEYLAIKEEDEETISLVTDAMSFENSEVWMKEKEKNARYKKEKQEDQVNAAVRESLQKCIKDLGEPFADYIIKTVVEKLYSANEEITKESVERETKNLIDSWVDKPGLFMTFVYRYYDNTSDERQDAGGPGLMVNGEPVKDTKGYYRDAKGRLRNANGQFVKDIVNQK